MAANRKTMSALIALVVFGCCGAAWARDGLSIGLATGFEADTFQYGQKHGRIAINNGLLTGTRNFWNELNSSVTIPRVYVDNGALGFPTDVTDTSSGLQGITIFDNFPVTLTNEVGDDQYFRPVNRAQALVSIPIGGTMKYSYKFLLFRFGFSYDIIVSNSFKPEVENSFVWNDNGPSFPPPAGATLSGQDIFDQVLQNAADSGTAILPSTGGRDITISQKISGERIDAPFSIALQFINTYALKAYVGGGITYFWGKVTRILQDTLPNTKADIDTYEGSTLGFHLLSGIEYEVVTRLGLSAEVFFNYGEASPVRDQVITEDPYTVSSFFHDPEVDQIGPENRNDPQFSRLEFSGIRLVIGLNYYIMQ